MTIASFEDFGLSDGVLRALSEMGYSEPTPIQKKAIPLALSGKDLIGQAQTGTGKTAAFGIPIVEAKGPREPRPYALVLTPTRELAIQVSEEIKKIGKYKKITTLAVYGGQPIGPQINELKKGVHIVVGTPGRIIDHLQRKTLKLSGIKILVLDEADEMLNMGFIEDIRKIIRETPRQRQTMLFSATMPRPIQEIAKRYMNEPEKIRFKSQGIVNPMVNQLYYSINGEGKLSALKKLLRHQVKGRTLLFCQTKKQVDELAEQLKMVGFRVGAIHGDYAQNKRERVLDMFKRGRINVLVATDVAARGLDIPEVECVINYSVPQNPDVYVHRIGRTARAGRTGLAITLVGRNEQKDFTAICHHVRSRIRRGSLQSMVPEEGNGIKATPLKKKVLSLIEEGLKDEDFFVIDEIAENCSYRELAAALMKILG